MKRKLPALGVMMVVTVVGAWIAYLILNHVPWGGISGGLGVWPALIFLADRHQPDREQNPGDQGRGPSSTLRTPSWSPERPGSNQ